jgi:hypothetical protein
VRVCGSCNRYETLASHSYQFGFAMFLGIIKISVAIEKHYQMTDMQIFLILILDYFCNLSKKILDYFCRVPITYIKMINGNQCNNFL